VRPEAVALRRRRLEPLLLNLACLGVALFILAPFAWMLISSLAGEAELTRRPPVFVPSPPTLANYAFIFTGQLPRDPARHGIFVWQNTPEAHPIDRFTAYHNGNAGIEHGAYTNRYFYDDATLYGNLFAGVVLFTESRLEPPPTRFARLLVDGAGITKYGILLAQAAAVNQEPVVVCQQTIQNLAPGGTMFFFNYSGEDAALGERLTFPATC